MLTIKFAEFTDILQFQKINFFRLLPWRFVCQYMPPLHKGVQTNPKTQQASTKNHRFKKYSTKLLKKKIFELSRGGDLACFS